MAKRAMEGLRVLEYANLVSGPYCTKLMADMGATVIKIEPPDELFKPVFDLYIPVDTQKK